MIRYARKEDAPRILQLIKDLAEYEKAPLEAKATLEQSNNPYLARTLLPTAMSQKRTV